MATLSFEGFDLTGATLRAQVRLLPDIAGTPLVDLPTVTSASTEGLRLISVATTGGVTTSIVGIRINETTMEGLPLPDEIGADALLYWDMHVTPSGGLKQRWLAGTFTVRAGVTQ
ncbi:hypothetical protein ABC347_07730 [Sphingomonas sp. 1P06PA]|uniref:hypothetical protein n=1 Tax=Sphingomonas sp. 1P06PA TaxID=554121 RepID=UPI0039A56E33